MSGAPAKVVRFSRHGVELPRGRLYEHLVCTCKTIRPARPYPRAHGRAGSARLEDVGGQPWIPAFIAWRSPA